MSPMIEKPTRKRPGHIVMTGSGYYKVTRTGPVPYDPSSWKKGKRNGK